MKHLILLADYVEKLLKIPVVVGRENYHLIDFGTDVAVVDSLTTTLESTDTQSFDLKQTIIQHYKCLATIELYGDKCDTNAGKFVALNSSNMGYDLQTEIGVNAPVGINNNVQNINNTYYKRVEIELWINYNIVVETETKSINKIPLSVNSEELKMIQSKKQKG